MRWWLSHIPSQTGYSTINNKAIYNNWWKYYAFFDETAAGISPPSISNLNATLSYPSPATFSFDYSGPSNNFIVDLSTFPDMSSDVYLTFASGNQSPLVENNPTKWDKYSCGRTLYLHVRDSTGLVSSIQSATVNCSNIIQNSSFENTGGTWLLPWYFQVRNNANGSIIQDSSTKASGTYSAKVYITHTSSNDSYLQLAQGNLPLTSGRTYTLTFSAKASKNRSVRVAVQQNHSPGTVFLSKSFNLTTSWQQYTTTFNPSKSDTNNLFSVNLANALGTVWIDNVSLQ